MNKPKELKLDMTNKEVTDFLGKPEKRKKTGDKAVSCLYSTILDGEEIIVKIRFVDNKVTQITEWSKDLNCEEV